MKEVTAQLSDLGFTDKEARTYVAMLELGSASVQQIAKKSGLVRTTLYDIVKDLQLRGLVSTQEKGKKQTYSAESPKTLQLLLVQQEKELEGRQKKMQDALSLLMALYNSPTEKPHVRYFEGEAGIVTIRDIMSASRGEYLSFAVIDEDLLERASSINEPQRQRMARRMRGKYLFALKPGCLRPSTDLRTWEVREIPYTSAQFKGEINIVDHKVCAYLFTKTSAVGLLIESPELSGLFRMLFMTAWQTAAYTKTSQL